MHEPGTKDHDMATETVESDRAQHDQLLHFTERAHMINNIHMA